MHDGVGVLREPQDVEVEAPLAGRPLVMRMANRPMPMNTICSGVISS